MVPLRADTGWARLVRRRRARRAGRAGPARPLLPTANGGCPQHERTVWKGVLRERDIADDDTGATHRLRIAYIWSSEEAASVADARERALTTAEDALTRIRNGLGGRYYKTQKQVDDRVAKIIGTPHRRPDHRHHRRRRPGQTHHRLAPQPRRHHQRLRTRRALRPRHQPARPTRRAH